MNRGRIVRLLLVPSLLVTTLSCAVTDQVTKNYQASTTVYPVPASLGRDTQESGLLLIDALGRKALNSMPVSGVAIASAARSDTLILAGSFRKGGMLSQSSGVVVIPDLEPGLYRLVRVKTENVNAWEVLDMPATPAFEVMVFAGKPTYFGQVQIRHPMGSAERVIEVAYDSGRERAAWQMVREKYADSPWSDAIAAHLDGM